jgi:hypothetical protein
MSIKTRLVKLEQRLCSGAGKVDVKLLSDEQLFAILRESLNKDFGIDVSRYSEDEVLDEYCRQEIMKETGYDCRDWPIERVWDEYPRLIGAKS